MGIFNELEKEMKIAGECGKYDGYWYSISHILLVLVCGMLCFQETIEDIHDWSKTEPTREFLREQFGMEKYPSRADFYFLSMSIDRR